MRKCNACGRILKMKPENRYEVAECKGAFPALADAISGKYGKVYEAFDCKYCGCQNIVNTRETGYVRDQSDKDQE